MKRYYKGSDIPFRFSIKDKNGKVIPLACFDSLEVVFRTTGEQYTKYYKGGGITENEDGTYRIYANENAFGLLPDGLLKYTVSFTVNGIHQEIKECETDIFIKTPKQFQPKANVQDKSITITENNSTSSVIPDGGYEGLGEVTINVEVPFPLEVKEVSITENESTTTITTGNGYSGMSEVNVNVKVPIAIKLPNGIKFANSTISKFPDGFDWSEISDMRNIFDNMTSVKDLGNINIILKPSSLYRTFASCNSLGTYPKIDTSEVTSMEYCFSRNQAIEECPYDFPACTNADYAFEYTYSLKSMPDFITKVPSINYVFYHSGIDTLGNIVFEASSAKCCFHHCHSLTTCGTVSFPNTTQLWDCFNSCTSLVSFGGLVADKVTSVKGFICECGNLETMGDFNCPSLTDIYGFAWNDAKLKKAPHFNSTKLQNIGRAYYKCTSLEEIPGFDCTNVNDTGTFATSCPALTTVGALQNLKMSISFADSPLLAVESMMNIINSIYDFTGNGKTPGYNQGTLTLGSTNLAKLTDEQKASATLKGWTLA